MTQSFGAGALFENEAHKRFMEVTGQRHDNMMARLEKKKLIDKKRAPFTKDELRLHLIVWMGNKEDGFVQCRYCKGYFTLTEIALDHAIPVNRGGSLGLDNIECPCKACNDIKGQMTPTEMLCLLAFLENELPLARQDILSRLQKAVSLAAGSRSIQAAIAVLKENGEWGKATKLLNAKKQAKKNNLGVF